MVPSDSQKLLQPPSIILACDARLGPTSYPDDQIWELQVSGQDQALAVKTTYGLRARMMRIFPRFIQGGSVREDVSAFYKPPSITRLSTSACTVKFSPFTGLDVQSDYWVPGSQVITGRILVENTSDEPKSCRLELAAQLVPIEGEGMSPLKAQASIALGGKAGDLFPVLFLTGGPEAGSGPYPSLRLEFNLDPGKSRRVTWAAVGRKSHEASLQAARQATAFRWEAAASRTVLQDAHDRISIESGNSEWDAVFAHSQDAAYRLFHSPGAGLPYPSFVLARTPEMGYSRRGDGSDYNYLWNGQPALESLFLAKSLLPGAARLAEGILLNTFARELPDWKPGLAGQQSGLLATPVLAELTWQVYTATKNRKFLEKVFPHLCAYLEAWFSARHDRDGDGYPEWDHIVHSGLEENPLFARGVEWGQGVDPACVESPALAAFLYNDCRRAAAIAHELDRAEDVQPIVSHSEQVREALSQSWDDQRGTYSYRDRDSHSTQPGITLFQGMVPYEVILDQSLPAPARLAFRILSRAEAVQQIQVRIIGKDRQGEEQTESFSLREIHWLGHLAVLTSQMTYASLGRIRVEGIGPHDQLVIETVDYAREDLSLFLPVWAGMAAPGQVEEMITRSLLDPARFGQPFGLPVSPGAAKAEEGSGPWMAPVLWNGLIIEGLARCGRREEAAGIFTGLMRAMSSCLNQEGCLRPFYNAVTGKPYGERDHAAGLFPTGIFLELLGIELISPVEMIISGNNPFQRPVTVKYRGTRITRDAAQTQVIFRDGKTATLDSPGTYRVLEKEGTFTAQEDNQEG